VDIPVLVAGQTRDITLDGTRYTLRAPSYGEHSALSVDLAAFPAPSTAVIDDALITAAEAAGRAELAVAIRALPEGEAALQDHFAACPPGLDVEGRRRWLDGDGGEQRFADDTLNPAFVAGHTLYVGPAVVDRVRSEMVKRP
jgi:hypothetical protein